MPAETFVSISLHPYFFNRHLRTYTRCHRIHSVAHITIKCHKMKWVSALKYSQVNGERRAHISTLCIYEGRLHRASANEKDDSWQIHHDGNDDTCVPGIAMKIGYLPKHSPTSWLELRTKKSRPIFSSSRGLQMPTVFESQVNRNKRKNNNSISLPEKCRKKYVFAKSIRSILTGWCEG